MIKEFSVYALFLTILLLAVTGHYLFSQNGIDLESKKVAQLTKIVEPAFAVTALEKRLPHLDKSLDNSVYPDMIRIDRVGFVYAK